MDKKRILRSQNTFGKALLKQIDKVAIEKARKGLRGDSVNFSIKVRVSFKKSAGGGKQVVCCRCIKTTESPIWVCTGTCCEGPGP